MYEKILVPLDGSPRAERILAYVEELAHTFKSKIYLLQIIHPEFLDASVHGYPTMMYRELLEEMRQEAENYLTVVQGKFREKGIESEFIVEQGSSVNIIISLAEQENVDLIAMTSHGRSALTRFFYGSVASGVLNRANRPVLMIRADD
jgi:nucleotide-binding universal stress UspA family protein